LPQQNGQARRAGPVGPPDRVLGYLDALAHLSSGDPDRAQQVVIDAFTSVCKDDEPTCRSEACPTTCTWRA
jgi:hypothetical protein